MNGSGHVTSDRAGVEEIEDPDRAFEVFDAVCRRELDIVAHEFLASWDAGHYEFVDTDSIEGLPEVVAALGLVGR